MNGTKALADQAFLGGKQPQPLTGHPAFTHFVVAWFAALFGLSSLAIRGSLLESWVMAARLDLIVPAAAPPLGMTARLLVALGFAVLGCGIGWLAARVLRPARHDGDGGIQLRSRDRHPDHPARPPISAHAELGDEGLGRADAPRSFEEPVREPYPVETFRSAYAEVPALAEPAQPQPFAVELPPATPFTDEPFLEDAPAAAPAFAEAPAIAAPMIEMPAFAPAMATGHTATVPDFVSPLALPAVPPIAEPAPYAPGAIAYPPPPPAGPISEAPFSPYPAPAWDETHGLSETQEHEALHDIPVITPFPLMAVPTVHAPHEPEDDTAQDTQGSWHSLPPLVSESDLEEQAQAAREQQTVREQASKRHEAERLHTHLASVTPIRPPLHLATPDDLPARAPEPAELDAAENEPAAMIGATPVHPRAHAEERIGQAALDDLSHVELIERLALAMRKHESQPEAEDESPVALPLRNAAAQGRALVAQADDMAGTQASLRSALAALREVK